MKTDIQLNFYDLECIYTKLDLYIQQIEELEATAIRYYRTISEQLSDSFQVETEMWDEFVLMKIVALRCYADTNKDLVEKYLTEMQAIIAPNDPTKMMRVDSADICTNLAQVKVELLGLADVYLSPSVSYPDYKATIWANFFSGLSFDERMELEQQECRNRQENYANMVAAKASLISAITKHVDDTLWTLYNSRIKEFENKDDVESYLGCAPDTVAMQIGDQIYVRSSSTSLISDGVHEGTHAMDYLNGID